MKLDILAFGAHPDDVELSCSGTVIKHIKAGKKVGLIDITRGEMGTRGSIDIRKAEAEQAMKIMGITIRENLGLEDCFFSNEKEDRIKAAIMIRKYQPDIVLANAVTDRHPDHGRAAKLVSDAAFISGLIKVETMLDGKPQQHWRPKAVYHYIQDYYIKPDFVIDVTAVHEEKMDAIRAFKSQFYNPESNEPESPISGREFLDIVQGRSMHLGRSIGVKYAEGFTVERTPGVQSLFDLF